MDADTLLYRVGFCYLGDGPEKYIQVVINSFQDTIDKAEEKLRKYEKNVVGDPYALLVFSGHGPKYRDQFNGEAEYKGTRKTAVKKPVYIKEMQEAIYERFDDTYKTRCVTTDSSWGEADDYVSVQAWGSIQSGTPYIVSGCDKDLLQIPGLHHNYVKNTVKRVSLEAANKHFFIQLLTGDTADSIPGIHGIGPKKAEYLLGGMESPDEMWEAVENVYLKTYGETHTADNIADMLYERGNKLWIKRDYNEVWSPPIPS